MSAHLRLDENNEDAAQHIRNALQVLTFAETLRRGADGVTLTVNDMTAVKARLRRALRLLEPQK